MASPSVNYSTWTWDPSRQDYFCQWTNAQGESGYLWQAESNTAQPSTPGGASNQQGLQAWQNLNTSGADYTSSSNYTYSVPSNQDNGSNSTWSSPATTFTSSNLSTSPSQDSYSASSFAASSLTHPNNHLNYSGAREQQQQTTLYQQRQQSQYQQQHAFPYQQQQTSIYQQHQSSSNQQRATSAIETGFVHGAENIDTLDPGLRQERPGFFKPGRVFRTLWVEPAGTVNGPSEAFTAIRYGQKAFTEIRRFVVVRATTHYSTCIAISTYGNQATLKPGVDPNKHAIIYYAHDPKPAPLRGERLTKTAFEVDAPKDSSSKRLTPESRLNFGKIYTVEHNIKVENLGMIAKKHMQLLESYYRQCNL